MKNEKRTTVYQVIDTKGKVIYVNTYLCNAKKFVRRHYEFSELSGKGGYATIIGKVTPDDRRLDIYKDLFPSFQSRSNGLFRRYVMQTVVTPHIPEAIVEERIVAYIINSFHENHIINTIFQALDK